MKKESKINYFLIILMLGAIALQKFTSWHFTAGMITGWASSLLLLSTIGRRQALKAGERIDKIINDNHNR